MLEPVPQRRPGERVAGDRCISEWSPQLPQQPCLSDGAALVLFGHDATEIVDQLGASVQRRSALIDLCLDLKGIDRGNATRFRGDISFPYPFLILIPFLIRPGVLQDRSGNVPGNPCILNLLNRVTIPRRGQL